MSTLELALIGALLSGSIPFLSTQIERIIKNQRRPELKKDVLSISDDLESIRNAIKDRRRNEGVNAIRSLKPLTPRLTFFLCDIEDFIDSYRCGGVKKSTLAGDVGHLKERVNVEKAWIDSIFNSTADGGGAPGLLNSVEDCRPVHPTGHNMVGMDQPLIHDLKEMLLESETASARKLRVISIVGFPGIGKTCLAKKLYEADMPTFSKRAWVSAAGKTPDEVGQEIQRENLGTDRYLVVIDDVTEEVWKHVSISDFFPEPTQVDNRVIVTTTIRSVAQECSSSNGHVYTMEKLSEKDSESLLFNLVSTNGVGISEAVKQDLSPILKVCDGLPLALVSIAKSLSRGKLTTQSCDEALKLFCDDQPQACTDLARMHRVLSDSYKSLPSDVIHDCLLYFTMFPQDHKVKSNPLIRRWLVERLAKPDAATKSLNNFIDHSIIKQIQVSNNERVKRCQPPGVMHKYISSKSLSEKFMFCYDHDHELPEEINEKEQILRLSLNPYDGMKMIVPGKSFRRLRTLAVFAPVVNSLNDETDFAQYDKLRVLDLEECAGLGHHHLRQICNLLLLKYLSLKGSISEIPRDIAKLKYLQTLDLRETSKDEVTVVVPVEVLLLPQLKHLLGKLRLKGKDHTRIRLKKDLSRKSQKLETLSGFHIGKRRGISGLLIHMISYQLRKLKIWLDSTTGKKNLAHVGEAINEFAGAPPSGNRSLSIDFTDSTDFLDSLQVRGGFKSLKLKGMLKRFPLFVENLTGVTELCLTSTHTTTVLDGNTIVASLKYLPVLKYLKLHAHDISGIMDIAPGQLDSLEHMCIVSKENLPKITNQAGALKYLDSLHLLCLKLTRDLPGIKIDHLLNLKEVALCIDLNGAIVSEWKAAAKKHPNTPRILRIKP